MKGKFAMKKFSALLLVLVMVASIISTSIVVTSAAGNTYEKSYDAAADGDVLYNVKFGETEGVYKPKFFAYYTKDATSYVTPTYSADKREITLPYTPELNGKGRIYYGGEFEGLTLGKDKSYTITLKAKFDTVNSNAGVYFNYPSAFAGDDPVTCTEYDYIRGYYGTPDTRSTLTIGGSKLKGKYISDDYVYVDNSYGQVFYTRDAEGWNDIALEVEGNTYRVYVNGIFFDECGMPDEAIAVAGKLGFCIYLYNPGTFAVKDVVVYKGTTMKASAVRPSYAVDTPDNPNSTNKLLSTYDAAKDGDLLYEVDFTATDGVYVPKPLRTTHYIDKHILKPAEEVVQVETTKNSVKFTNLGQEGAFWWGNIINGLSVTKDTKYTFEYKVVNHIGGKQGGFGFVTDPDQIITQCYNFYGRFTTIGDSQAQVVIERNTGKIPGILMGTKDYTPVFPLADADGFMNVKVELDGYVFSVYYECMYEEGGTNWTLFEQYDMAETLLVRDNSLCCMFYIYNGNTALTFKDVKIYKGLTTPRASSESETTPADTTPADTTPAPTTPADTTTAPKPADTTTSKVEQEKGCGSVVAGGIAVIAIVSLAGVAVSKKH